MDPGCKEGRVRVRVGVMCKARVAAMGFGDFLPQKFNIETLRPLVRPRYARDATA